MTGDRRGRVLVVDDSPDVTQLLALWLGQTYAVFTANSGLQGLILAETVFPHVALLDIVMAPPNGFEVADRFRHHPRLARTRVIFITGLDHAANASRALELGAVDLLYKPLDERILLERVRSAVELAGV